MSLETVHDLFPASGRLAIANQAYQRQKVIEYLTLMEKEHFPASRDEVLEELLHIESITNLCYDGKEGKKKSEVNPSVNTAAIEESDRRNVPEMITLEDGHQGFQRADGNFEVFKFSSEGKFIDMKVVIVKRNLKSTTIKAQEHHY